MFQISLDAIRALLAQTFPIVSRIYVSRVPTGFIRPSFFVELISGGDDDLNKAMYRSESTWQIVYFAKLNADNDADPVEQLQVADALKQTLMDDQVLTAPDGTIFHILECSGGPRDAEAFITLRLELDKRRPEPQYDLMGDVQHNLKEG